MSSGSDSDWPLEPWTVQVLGDVRQRGYAPVAWAGLLASSWQRARETAHRETALVGAWRRLTLALLTGSTAPIAFAWRRCGPRHGRRMGTLLLVGLGWQQANAYLHLGMNRRLSDGVLLPEYGAALWLTYLRGAAAACLLAATLTGLDLPGLAPGTVMVGALTDALDGPLARRCHHVTKLGAYADGEADVMLAVALTLAAVRRGALHPTAVWSLLGARYLLPISVAFGVAFTRGRAPHLAHTRAGRLCGVAQAALMACALAPRRWQRVVEGPRRLLFLLTAVLAVASGLSHVPRILLRERGL